VQDENAGAYALGDDEFKVVQERTGEGGFFRATTETFDVVVLSSVLPTRGGLEVLAALRAQGVATPVLLVASCGDVAARVAALDAGADDVVAPPLMAPELQARVRALARRGASQPVTLCVGDLELDPMARTARRAGRPLQLTLREFQLLEYLVRRRGEVVSRERLWQDLWQGQGTRLPHDNVLDVHVARLRRKVDGGAPVRLIHTVRGVGFTFGEQADRRLP
jgi:DNA-binding response OmpR family regulator